MEFLFLLPLLKIELSKTGVRQVLFSFFHIFHDSLHLAHLFLYPLLLPTIYFHSPSYKTDGNDGDDDDDYDGNCVYVPASHIYASYWYYFDQILQRSHLM